MPSCCPDSSKLQHSTNAQVQHNVEYAARHGQTRPPEFICVDEAGKGAPSSAGTAWSEPRRSVKSRLRTAFCSCSTLCLLRTGYRSFQFVNEDVVDVGFEGRSATSQGIDTRDEKIWEGPDVFARHDGRKCSSIPLPITAGLGLKTLFQARLYHRGHSGWFTVLAEFPGAPASLTACLPLHDAAGRSGRPPKLIQQHYEWIRDGMTIREGWRRWVGCRATPCYIPLDARLLMSCQGYRRMLSNPHLLWAAGPSGG